MTPEEVTDEVIETIQDALDDNSFNAEDRRTVLNLLIRRIGEMTP